MSLVRINITHACGPTELAAATVLPSLTENILEHGVGRLCQENIVMEELRGELSQQGDLELNECLLSKIHVSVEVSRNLDVEEILDLAHGEVPNLMNRNYLIRDPFQFPNNFVVCGLDPRVDRGQNLLKVQLFENKLLVKRLVQVADDRKNAEQTLSGFEQQCWS